MAEKKEIAGIILAISCTNKAHASEQDDFWENKTLANYVAKVVCYIYRYYVLSLFSLSWIMRLQHGGCNFPG